MMSQLNDENKNLKEELKELSKQKKQFKNVVILLLLVIGCGVGIYFLYDNLNVTQGELAQANSTIVEKDSVINEQRTSISSLTSRNNDLKNKYDAAIRKHGEYVKTITGHQPFLFKSASFNFNSGDLKITYYGLTEGSHNFSVRVIAPDNNVKNYDKTISVSKGDNSASVYISSYFNPREWYTFELLYNRKVIGGVRQ